MVLYEGKKRLREQLLGEKKLLLEGRTQVVQGGGKKRLLGCAQVEFELALASPGLLIRAAMGGGAPGSCAGRMVPGRGEGVRNSCRIILIFPINSPV